MAITKIDIDQFVLLGANYPVLDVRSPSEFAHAHIPGALNLPLFSDAERKVVGTAYKQQSRETAIKIGLDFFGPKMRNVVDTAEHMCEDRCIPGTGESTHQNTVLLHCWRGGMRSAAIAWLLDLYGFKVYTLNGGYKKFRQFVLGTLQTSFPCNILGGYTGSAKTEVIWHLQKSGAHVIDLERIAKHKGSAFGAIGQGEQPSQEMFENLLAVELYKALNDPDFTANPDRGIWLEDESQRIGLVNIPPDFWQTMRRAPVWFMEIPFELRLAYLVSTYGKLEIEKMVNAIIRIRKRLGPVDTKAAIQFLLDHNFSSSFSLLLKYYDKFYRKGLEDRDNIHLRVNIISVSTIDPAANAALLLREQAGFQIREEQIAKANN